MSHQRKTRAQLVTELEDARKQISELEAMAAAGSSAGAGRLRAEKDLADAHRLLNAVIEQSPMPMAIATPDGKLWQVNQACAEHLGIEGDPAVREGASLRGLKRSWKIFDQDGNEVPEDRLPLPLTFQGVTTHDRVLRVVRSDGTERWGSANAAPLTGDDGGLIAGFLAMPDITERMRAEARTRDSEATTRAMLDALPDLMFRLSRDGTHLDFFAPEDELYALPEDIVGKTVAELLPRQVAEQYLERIGRTLSQGQVQVFDYSLDFPGFDTRTYEARMVSHGNDAVLVLVRNITARVRAEEALRESEFQLAESQRVAGLGSYVLDIPSGAWSSSPILDQIFDIGADFPRDVEGWVEIVHPDDRAMMQDYFATHVLGNHERFDREYRIKRAEGESELWVHGLGELEFDGDGNPTRMIGTIQNITERKQSEEALRTGERRANALLEAIPDLIFRMDEKGSVLDYHAEESRLPVRAGARISGRNISEALPPELAARIVRHISLTLDSGAMQTFEYRWAVRRGAGPRDFEARMVKSGEKEVIAFVRDITERRALEAEKVKLEQQLRHSQKLETVGTLAGGIAHDFNNILTPIMGYGEMLRDRLRQEDAASSDVDRILGAAHRAKELVERILLFSQQIEKERKPVRIQLVAEEAIQLLRPSIPTTISIEEMIDPSCDPVLADDTQIHQVVVNLCTNAFQAMENTGGTLRIEVEQVAVDAVTARSRPNLTEREYVRLSVRDTGPGMDEDTLARVFEPFFTTKAVDRGSGMGLSVVHGIVSSHDGDVLVESIPGEGAVFHVYLPTMGAGVAVVPEAPREVKGGAESILVVDDDEAVARVVMMMLNRLGYRVSVFTNSPAALDELRESKDRYDLVISDLTMPHMTGLELAQRMPEARTGIPILIMTGYGEKLEQSADSHRITKFIAKPITMETLAAEVRAVLDA